VLRISYGFFSGRTTLQATLRSATGPDRRVADKSRYPTQHSRIEPDSSSRLNFPYENLHELVLGVRRNLIDEGALLAPRLNADAEQIALATMKNRGTGSSGEPVAREHGHNDS